MKTTKRSPYVFVVVDGNLLAPLPCGHRGSGVEAGRLVCPPAVCIALKVRATRKAA